MLPAKKKKKKKKKKRKYSTSDGYDIGLFFFPFCFLPLASSFRSLEKKGEGGRQARGMYVVHANHRHDIEDVGERVDLWLLAPVSSRERSRH
jgi:hypothetical protein